MSLHAKGLITTTLAGRLPGAEYMFVPLLILCYLVGAASTSFLLAKWLTDTDIRTFGSGNSGATNASRLLGIPYFFLITFLDAAKAYGVLYLATRLVPELSLSAQLVCAAAVLIGNAFSIFLSFRGGKGAAVAVGLLCFFLPIWAVAAYVGIFAGLIIIIRRVDVAVLLAALCGTGVAVTYAGLPLALQYGLWGLAAWVWVRHWQNILYLLGLYEPRR